MNERDSPKETPPPCLSPFALSSFFISRISLFRVSIFLLFFLTRLRLTRRVSRPFFSLPSSYLRARIFPFIDVLLFTASADELFAPIKRSDSLLFSRPTTRKPLGLVSRLHVDKVTITRHAWPSGTGRRGDARHPLLPPPLLARIS